MSNKTDNPNEVGLHVFERAGLGQAPYRLTACTRNVYVACQGAPAQPGGTCAYCGNSIMDEFWLLSRDGKRFAVGCDCINKSGDNGLIRAYKTSPEFRKLQAAKRQVKATAVLAELDEFLTKKGELLASYPPPNDKNVNLRDYVQWWRDHAGASGRASTLRFIKRVLAGTTVYNEKLKHYVQIAD